MDSNLKSTAIKGARWGTIENLLSLSVTFIVGVILSRILSPEEFGLVGYLTIFIALSITLIDNGFSTAIIRKKEATKEDLSTAFITNLSISVVCLLLIYFIAPWVASYFGEPQLRPLLRVLSCVLIINALSIVQRVILVKELDFKRLTICSVSSSILSGVIGIVMALNSYGVWSLVAQQVSKQFINSVMLWIVGKWRVSLNFSKSSFKELFAFGNNVMISGLLDTLFKNLYYPVIGKYFSTADLGQYSRADQFSNVTSNNLSQIVQRVSLPILSKAQTSEERLQNSFRTMAKVCCLCSSAACFWLSAVSMPLIVGLVGEKWIDAAQMLQIIALAGVLLPLHYLNQNMLQIKGKMRLYLSLEIFKKIIILLAIAIGVLYGLTYLLWGSVIASVVAYFVFAYYSGKESGYSVVRQSLDIIAPMLFCFVSAIVCGVATLIMLHLFKNYFEWSSATLTNLLATAIGSIIGFLALALLYRIFPRKEWKEAINLIRKSKEK